jgi:hypothetical protein
MTEANNVLVADQIYGVLSTLILIGCYTNLCIFDWLLLKSIKHYFNIYLIVH